MLSRNSPHHVVWLIPMAALSVALLEMPYGYYQLLRVLIFCVSCFLALKSSEEQQQTWAWVFGALAIIYNPIVRLHLGTEIWPIVNVGSIVILAVHLWLSRVRKVDPGSRPG